MTSRQAARREAVYLGLTRWLPYLLNRKDRLSMYAGVEGRVPLCDQTLVEYMWNVPSELQRMEGVEKNILRRAFAGLVPDSVLHRKKSAFPFYENPSYAGLISGRASLDGSPRPR